MHTHAGSEFDKAYIGEWGTDLSRAPKVLSYGEKVVKIGVVYPEIFD